MKEVWVWSDPHLGHTNCYKFTNYDGTPMRPWDDMQEAEEYMIQQYNELVHEGDTCYWLGDICGIQTYAERIMPRFNKSRRILVLGNHDAKLGAKYWLKWFNNIRGDFNRDNHIFSHFPVCSGSKGRFKRNVHGHTHCNYITVNNDGKIKDIWYRNVCVEAIGYRPINFSEILEETQKYIDNGQIIIPKKGSRIV